jgi:hypothetical protein
MYKQFDVETSGKLVPVGAVEMPATFIALFTGDDGGGPDVALRFEVRNGAPECREVRVTATADGREVRHSGIVGLRIEDILEKALQQMLLGSGDVGPSGLHRWLDHLPPTAVSESRQARSARRVTITDALLREVAEVYRAAASAGKPTSVVADHFGVAHRTAALYVQKARAAGHLPPTTQGKAQA